MKTLKSISKMFALGFVILMNNSCNAPKTKETTPNKAFLTSFQPDYFENDVRAEEIRKLLPEIEQLIKDHAAARKIPGVSFGIVVDNSLVLTASTGVINREKEYPTTTSSVFRIASMTKSFTAMAILKLRDDGKLKLSDPVSNYIPEAAGITYNTSDSPILNIRHLLTMTGGFPEDNPWGDRQLDESNEMLLGMIDEGLSFSSVPAFQYEYSNLGYAMLGNIVSKVSGIPSQQYIRNEVFEPLGMSSTYWEYDEIPEDRLVLGYRTKEDGWELEPMLHDGSFGAMGGLITTIEDFSKYVSLHLSAWPPRNGEETGPVKRSTLREMHTQQFSRVYANNNDYNGDPCPSLRGYGYGLSITRYCNGIRRVSHGGALPGFGSNYVFYPQYGIGLMAFGNLTYTSPWPLNDIEKLIFNNEKIQRRELRASDIFNTRKDQLMSFIQSWDVELEKEIIAENLYLDQDRDARKERINEVLAQAGELGEIYEVEPYNKLRGYFKIRGENGDVRVFFSLTPEKEPKVQRLIVRFIPKE